jgi:hypothetical protein
MRHLEWLAHDRLNKFQEQLDIISKSEFSRISTRSAIQCIKEEIYNLRNRLSEVANITDEIFLIQHTVTINQKIYNFTNSLGVLLRSTNLRNCFEAYFAFDEMVYLLTGQKDILIISSEWDATPFFIPHPPDAVSKFVFIGMPAFASRNSLLLPLAAHELGHAIWRLESIDGPLVTTAEQHLHNYINSNHDIFLRDFQLTDSLFLPTEKEEIISRCLTLVESQCQELFCDLFGASLFKESFAYAFDHFLFPGFGRREYSYPSFSKRLRSIKDIFFKAISDRRSELLNETVADELNSEGRRAPLVILADYITDQLRPSLVEKARQIAEKIDYASRAGEKSEEIAKNLRNHIPPNNPCSPVDILNGAWKVWFEEVDRVSSISEREKLTRMMNNLCLKSLEVYEYNRINKT